MERSEFIESISRQTELPREAVEKLTDAFRDILASKAGEGDAVTLPGFGSFEPKKRLERIAYHPATGRKLLVPPKITLVFRPSAILKQKINRSSSSD